MAEPVITPEADNEQYPLEPRYHPVNRLLRRIYDFLASSRLAMALLITILLCCVVGVTAFRYDRAWQVIFTTVWFNALLVMLVVNVAFCFFGRIWGRRVTIISLGMILFHLSFVAILGGIVYNSLFYFKGTLRLTEGETLPNGDFSSYDLIDHGKFFDISRIKGETTLVKMQPSLKVDGIDKRTAYTVEVGEPGPKKQEQIYITKNLEYKGVYFYTEKEGYAPCLSLTDSQGRDLYQACVPLQSLKQKDESYLYTSGSKDGPGAFPFPQGSSNPLYLLQVGYKSIRGKEREGTAHFSVWPYADVEKKTLEKPLAEGNVALGTPLLVDGNSLTVKEIRFWAAMTVRYDPGKPLVLASLWVGLGGMILTTIGRMMKGTKAAEQKRTAV